MPMSVLVTIGVRWGPTTIRAECVTIEKLDVGTATGDANQGRHRREGNLLALHSPLAEHRFPPAGRSNPKAALLSTGIINIFLLPGPWV
jgi:hypothetical protein